ncbi:MULTISPECIES: pentapeptide repeat-containing protein [Pseudomonas]|uniref:pentapeptide repeat-containing protein n=1 Tax=Pseudomonas TaxID=286 RepID=UPI00234C5FB2|nr:pentapeptide repeat-containing protein [Pseudomonas sp. BLCC-B112]MDC7817486.1 pentapeptide repeat-containing protein [Pseudomonas sp. BLCC-B112]
MAREQDGQELTPPQIAVLQMRWNSAQGRAVIEDMLDDLRQHGDSWLSPTNHFAASSLARSGIPTITDSYVVDLRGINFDDHDLSGLDLCFMDLSHASFQRCTLTGACLQRSDLSFANFSHSLMPKADLLQIYAHEAVFDHCVLEGAMMMASDLSNSSFCHANLQRVVLDNSNVTGCHFTTANTRFASFASVFKNDLQAQKKPGPMEPDPSP